LFISIFDSSSDTNVLAKLQTNPSWQSLKLGHRGWSLLHLAVWKGNFLLVKQLIDAGLSPYEPDNSGETALNLAKELYDTELVELLGGSEGDREKCTISTGDAELRTRHKELIESNLSANKAGGSIQPI